MGRWSCTVALLLLLTGSAGAGSFRGASVSWRIPDTAGAPNTIEVSITTIWDRPTSDATTADLDFGDGTNATGLSGAAIYTSTTPLGQGYTVQQTTVTHTYAAGGTYALVLSGCCRHVTTNNNDGTSPFKLTATAAIGTGMHQSPAWLTIEPTMTDNGKPEVDISTAFGDAHSPAVREASQAESGLAIPVLQDGLGHSQMPNPSIQRLYANVKVEWNALYSAGQTYELGFVVSDARGGSSAIDFISEITASSGVNFSADAWEVGGAPGQTISDGGLNTAGTTITLVNLPASATVTSDSSRWTVSWIPAGADLGTVRIALLELVTSDGRRSELGIPFYVALQVNECALGMTDCAPTGSWCRDEPWGYQCTCRDFFTGDGETCTAFCGPSMGPQCLTPTGRASAFCCGDQATGNYSCTCPDSGDTTTSPTHGCDGCTTTDGTGAVVVGLGLLLSRRRRRR